MATNLRRRNGVEQLLTVLAELYASGRPVQGRDAVRRTRPRERSGLAGAARLAPAGACSRQHDADAALMPRIASRAAPVLGASAAAHRRRARRAGASAGRSGRRRAAVGRLLEEAGDRPSAAVADPRTGVMASYFDLMRGFLEQQRAVVEAVAAARRQPRRPRSPEDADGRCRSSTRSSNARETQVVARCHLSLEDEFLRSHILSGRVLRVDPGLVGPGVRAADGQPGDHGRGLQPDRRKPRSLGVIENVRAFDWIALDDEVVALEVHAEVIDAARRLIAPGSSTAGRWRRRPTSASSANGRSVRCRRWPTAGPRAGTGPSCTAPACSTARCSRASATSSRGARKGIDAALTEVGLEGFFRPGVAPSLILNPVLLDAVGQVAAYWIAQHAGTDFNCFPSTIAPHRAATRRARPASKGSSCAAASNLSSASPTTSRRRGPGSSSASMRGGEPLFASTAWSMSSSTCRMPSIRCGAIRCADCWARRATRRASPGVALWEVPQFSEDFCAQSSGIFLRILAHALLGPEERDEWRCARHRRAPAPRVAARAARQSRKRCAWCCTSGPAACCIRPTSSSAMTRSARPHVDGWWCDELGDPPQVSLSHTARACLVAVSDSESAVGVDFEDLGRVGQPDLLLGALTPDERARAGGVERRGPRRATAAPVVREGSRRQVPRRRPAGPPGRIRRALRRPRMRPCGGRFRRRDDRGGDRLRDRRRPPRRRLTQGSFADLGPRPLGAKTADQLGHGGGRRRPWCRTATSAQSDRTCS